VRLANHHDDRQLDRQAQRQLAVAAGGVVRGVWLSRSGRRVLRRLRPSTLQESRIDRPEYQDNSDVCYQPFQQVVPEEQDVHADHDGYQRKHVQHDG
jgi:hypothetical protein